MPFATQEEYVSFLEARVEALEEALRRRSRLHRLIQRAVSPEDLLAISRLESGLPPMPKQAYDLSLWEETTDLEEADVEDTMHDLWRSLTPLPKLSEDEPHSGTTG